MKIKLIVKERNNRKYCYLILDLGYKFITLEYIDYKVAEMLYCSVADLKFLDIGEYEVGSIYGLEK